MAFSLLSTGFRDGERIPVKHTCDGEDVSPPLTWSGAPDGTKTFALIMDDPDAPFGTFTHWVLFNLPKSIKELPEGVPNQGALSGGGVQGRNDFGRIGYGGPCPPRGSPHTYQFHLYALDTELNLRIGASKGDVLKAVEHHILAATELRGVYGR